MLKVKPNPTIDREGNYVVNVESYWGMILHTWFDRPLSLAGKVVCKSENVFAPNVFLYDSASPVAVIPSLAIHMDKEVNKKNELNCQVHLLPLVALKERPMYGQKWNVVDMNGNDSHGNWDDEPPVKDELLNFIAEQLDVEEDDILDYDLFFYNGERPRYVGLNSELLVSPRLDNLTSCYSAVESLINNSPAHTAVVALFDHEEVGSRSKQGADSVLFTQFLEKLTRSMNRAGMAYQISKETLLSKGFVMSLDVAHAYHPNYSDKSDPTTKTLLGCGAVLKTSGSQRYHSDSASNAAIMQLAKRYDVALQRQINRSDIVGGSTLGPIVSSYLPIPGVDVGVPVLAMHSAVETAAVSDTVMLQRLVAAFFDGE
jgi:aspartyl aminopeptidase